MRSTPPWAGGLWSVLVATCLTLTACGGSQDASPSKPSEAQPTSTPQLGGVAATPAAPPTVGTSAATSPLPMMQRVSAERNPAAAVYERNAGSVVNITSTALARTPLGPAEQQGSGSGFVLDAEGRIVTNNHVVQDADQLNVTFKNNATVPASLVGRDPDNDLAVIRVDPAAQDTRGRPIRELLKPVTLGNSDQVVIGTDAIAIGSPLGLPQTVSAGIISAIRSPLETGRGQVDLLGGAVQTDAPINPGNSGGPLFNAVGEVIGINTAILSQSGGNVGIGFAIPINVAKRVVPELIQHGCYRHPYIGVSSLSLARLGQSLKQQLGIPPNQIGQLVQEATAGAAQAGIRAGSRAVTLDGRPVRVDGDIIVAIDGQEVTTGGELRGYIENTKRPGDVVTLTVLRDGNQHDMRVTLRERPDQQACP